MTSQFYNVASRSPYRRFQSVYTSIDFGSK